MKNKSPFDLIFLMLFVLTLGIYLIGFQFIFHFDPFDGWQLMLQRCYSYLLRPLHYFFAGYVAAWLLLVHFAQGSFFLRPKASIWVGALSILIVLGYLGFSIQYWFLFGKGISRIWVEIYSRPFYLVLPGIALCAALRPVPQKGSFPEKG